MMPGPRIWTDTRIARLAKLRARKPPASFEEIARIMGLPLETIKHAAERYGIAEETTGPSPLDEDEIPIARELGESGLRRKELIVKSAKYLMLLYRAHPERAVII